MYPFFAPDVILAQVAVENTATYLGDNRWRWKIFIAEDNETLNRMSYVEYMLHPTFPNPHRIVYDRSTNFALTAIGWGTFTVKGRVHYTDNRTQNFEHSLVFDKRRASSHLRVSSHNWSRAIEPGWWEWGVFIDGDAQVLDNIRCVEYTLHRTFPDLVRVRCTRGNRFELRTRGWGTFNIPIKVLFKDGSILEMTHSLQFK